jgi:hypothetical protein
LAFSDPKKLFRHIYTEHTKQNFFRLDWTKLATARRDTNKQGRKQQQEISNSRDTHNSREPARAGTPTTAGTSTAAGTHTTAGNKQQHGHEQ